MKRKKIKRAKAKYILISILLTFLIIAAYLLTNATKMVSAVSEATIRSITTVAVNDAIYYTLNDNLRYEDLIRIDRDENGNVTTITANSLKINRIARDTAYLSQENLNRMSEEGIMIPIGAFTGIKILAGFGKKVNVKIIPISNVECKFVSSFTDAGINQTKHSIYLQIVSDISIIMPSKTTNLASNTQVLVCESVINGNIPSVYLNNANLNGYNSLVP